MMDRVSVIGWIWGENKMSKKMLLARSRTLGYTKLYLKPIPSWKKTLDMPSCVLSQVEVRRGC
jgi:hypothetical protein